MQQLQASRKWRLRLPGGDDLRDDFQGTQQIDGAVGFGKAGVTTGQRDL
jgi:hypothetical protein